MDWLNIKGKVFIVTGGANGIGKAVSDGLAESGASVVVADVNQELGDKVVAELAKKFGGTHLFVKTDVTRKASVEALTAAAIAKFGKIDVLVNNAGINIPRLLVDPAGKEEISEETFDKLFNINVKGYVLCAQAAAREMIKSGKGGVIINMASESGSAGSEGQSLYAATKACAYNLTLSWSKELGKHGVRVAGIAPGIMEATALRSPEYERALAYTRGISVEQLNSGYEHKSIPLRRVGKLSEVANLVCFMASERGGYLHGTTVCISGGKTRS